MNLLFLNKLFNHFYFRILQLFRVINYLPNIGAAYVLTFIFILFVKIDTNNILYPIIFIFPIWTFHLNRKDLLFIKKIFNRKWQLIILIEYLSIFMFFCSVNINYKISYHTIVSGIFIIGITYIKTNIFKKNTIKLGFINPCFFEWKSLIRKNIFIFIAYYTFLLLSVFHPFTLLLFGTIFLDYLSNIFKINESKEMLIACFSKILLKEKIKKNILFLNILLTPIYICYLVKNFDYIDYLAYYILFINTYYILTIVRKYKSYRHNKPENDYNTGVYVKLLIISFLIIPAFFEIKKNISLANRNIKNYVRNR